MTRAALVIRLAAAILIGALPAPLWLHADTIHLRNGATIDGVITGTQDGTVVILIGNMGKLCIAETEIARIERNDRTGPLRGDDPPAPRPAVPDGSATGKSPASGASGSTEQARAGNGGTGKPGSEVARDDAGKPRRPALTPEQEKELHELVFQLTRQDNRKRTRAEHQLLGRGPEVIPFVLPLTTHPLEWTRVATFRILHRHGGEEVVDAALLALEDDSQWVRKLAWETLCKVSGRGFPFPWDENSSATQRQQARTRWVEWWDERRRQRDEEQRTREEGMRETSPGGADDGR